MPKWPQVSGWRNIINPAYWLGMFKIRMGFFFDTPDTPAVSLHFLEDGCVSLPPNRAVMAIWPFQ
jgi:hypothetical protein